MTHPTPPATLADDLRQLTRLELSLPSRLRYVSLLLIASAMSAVVIALLVTESGLPLRTTVALGVLAMMGLSWMAFAVWVLTRKRILLGNHRIVAGRLAVVFSAIFVIGAIVVGVSTANASAFAAAAMGGLMLAVALTMWVRAKRHFAQLSKRRAELERLLGRGER